MTRLAAALLLGAFAATPGLAQTPFDGNWKVDLSTLTMPKKPDVFALSHGMYTCDSCDPRVAIRADGAQNYVTGHRYYDHIAVDVLSSDAIRVRRYFQASIVFSEELSVSPDGKKLSFTFRDTTRPREPIIGSGSAHRIGRPPHPEHAHPVTGTWKLDRIKHETDYGLVFSMKSQGAAMHVSTGTGQSYVATIGGSPVPITGDPLGTTATLKRLSATTLQEIDTRAGTIVSVVTMTVAPGGRTMTVVTNEAVHGGMQTYRAVKQ